MSKTIKLGLLGNNLGRSRAKNLHELLGEIYNLNVIYQPIDLLDCVAPVSLEDELHKCQAGGFCGVNVTHPYKRDAFNLAAVDQHFPDGLTSVNTILFTPSGLRAYNTDYSGCCRAFTGHFGVDFKPGKVLLLGAGGVGVAIAFALKLLGAEELVISDIKESLARNLVDRMATENFAARLAGADLLEEMACADGLVNATPIGMFQYPGNPFDVQGLRPEHWAFDAVYTPENTAFLKESRRLGLKTLSGFRLFLYQGLDAFQHFTGIIADDRKIEPLFLERFPLE
jgi:shikimate dehydrogenase